MSEFTFSFFEGGQKAPPKVQKDDGVDEDPAPVEELTLQEDESTTTEQVAISDDIEIIKGNVSSEEAAQRLQTEQLKSSDLIPGKYEGGFKLWEGALDLCKFLVDTYNLDAASLRQQTVSGKLAGARVLELGCGHGLPGILCLLAGATVHFQDYNQQVLSALTAPNVGANLATLPDGAVRGGRRYFAGSWSELGRKLAEKGLGGHYDIVLTSETIYNAESQDALLDCIKHVLQPPHGVVYVAAKSYYHGVGGGTASFTDLVRQHGMLECEQVWKLEDGSSNKREILKLRFPESITPYFL